MLQYRAVVHRGNGQFWIELPDFPEITHQGLLGQDNPVDAAAACLVDVPMQRSRPVAAGVARIRCLHFVRCAGPSKSSMVL